MPAIARKSQLITAVSMPAPEGGTITEVGVPSMMPDGRVIFGAEVHAKDTNIKARWVILVGDADAKPGRRLTPALNPKAIVGNCIPAFKGDPYPVADATAISLSCRWCRMAATRCSSIRMALSPAW